MTTEVQTRQDSLRFVVPAVPVAQPRQRQRVVAGKGRNFVMNYTPAKHPVNAFKGAVQVAYQAAASGPPLEGPLGILLHFVLPRPKAAKRFGPLRCWRYSGRADWDNLAKAFVDSLNGIAWRDDSQIVSADVRLLWAGENEAPHVVAGVWRLY